MKRSEMVKKLTLDLEDIIAENYYDEKGSEWCANLILMSMEESGMSPPPRWSSILRGETVKNEIERLKWDEE